MRLTEQREQDFELQFCRESGCEYYGEPDGCNHPDYVCASNCYFTVVAEKLREYEDLEEDGRLKVLPCKLGDPLYFIADEDDVGNEIPTVKEYPGGVSAIIITASGLRVADSVELSQIVEYSNEIGTRYAYLSPQDAEAALEGCADDG